ncbi:MAG: AAA family ATPase [Phycisphaerales bacterium]
MITAIEATNYRGIREGKLDGLTPLTVLVGPNGCGKSAMLEGAFICGAVDPIAAMNQVLERRRAWLPSSARWIVNAEAARSPSHSCTLSLDFEKKGTWTLKLHHAAGQPVGEYAAQFEGPATHASSLARLAHRVAPSSPFGRPTAILPHVVWLDPHEQSTSLHDLFSQVVRLGLREELLAALRGIYEGFDRAEILTDQGTPYLSLHSSSQELPADLGSAGQVWLLRVISEILARPNAVFLLEEPETHLHPRAMRIAAAVMRRIATKDRQIILTTHSLEFIDALLDGATDAEMQALSVFRLQLTDGKLASSRTAGEDVRLARFGLESDLR